LLVDDVLATGGTASAGCRLVEELGGTLSGVAFLIELGFLKGRGKLGDRDIHSLITY
jgi:adenine phosphoribosyltransferase